MRISFNQKYQVNLNSILNAQERLQNASAKLDKQTKILSPSDDPSGSARVISLDQQIDSAKQFETNSNLAKNDLSLEESVLTSIQSSINRAKVLTISLGNGSYSQSDRIAVVNELSNIRSELLDLMNKKDSSGGYIFSGYKDQNQAYTFNSATGYFDYGGAEGQKFLQISNSVTISVNESGKNTFENVDARFKTTNPTTSGGVVSAKVNVLNQSSFDAFYRQSYDALTPSNNDYRISLTAPDQYEIRLQNGTALNPAVNGTVVPGQAINFQGLSIEVNGTFPGAVDFSLKAPEKKNILNTLTDVINAVEKNGLTDEALRSVLNDANVQMERSLGKIGDAISAIGGKQNLLQNVTESTVDLRIANTQFRADIYDLDIYEGITELTKQETVLQTVRSTFGKLTSTSLFDFIR